MSVQEVSDAVVAGESNEAAEFVAGFQRVEGEIKALSERELVPVNIDIPGAVATVLGSLPELRALKPKLLELSDFDVARFDKLRDYALALGHTHAMYRAATGPSDIVTDLAENVMELRDILQADAAALAKRRILDEAQVEKLRGGNGYKNMAFEVAGLVGLFREHWDEIKGRSALELPELEHAGRRAQELVTAVGVREQSPAIVGAAAALRQRAFTLLLGAYDDARRAVSYFRWHEGDADTISPSLFAGRSRRSTEEGTTPGTPSTGTPSTGTRATPGSAPNPPAAAAAGLPGSSPFAHS